MVADTERFERDGQPAEGLRRRTLRFIRQPTSAVSRFVVGVLDLIIEITPKLIKASVMTVGAVVAVGLVWVAIRGVWWAVMQIEDYWFN